LNQIQFKLHVMSFNTIWLYYPIQSNLTHFVRSSCIPLPPYNQLNLPLGHSTQEKKTHFKSIKEIPMSHPTPNIPPTPEGRKINKWNLPQEITPCPQKELKCVCCLVSLLIKNFFPLNVFFLKKKFTLILHSMKVGTCLGKLSF